MAPPGPVPQGRARPRAGPPFPPVMRITSPRPPRASLGAFSAAGCPGATPPQAGASVLGPLRRPDGAFQVVLGMPRPGMVALLGRPAVVPALALVGCRGTARPHPLQAMSAAVRDAVIHRGGRGLQGWG
jgi:hypothetical protein